jgi:hypothetical protein
MSRRVGSPNAAEIALTAEENSVGVSGVPDTPVFYLPP